MCGGTKLTTYLNFGKQPLANAYRTSESYDGELRVPLVVRACQTCKLSQLTHVVSPDVLYKDYAFQSGTSKPWREHCEKLAKLFVNAGKHCIDIASNDGTMVRALGAQGAIAIGVDPTPIGEYPQIAGLWGEVFVRERVPLGEVDLITAQNVLGHVDDVHDFMAGIALALADDGRAIIEVPYLLDLFKALAFDTIYHEHLSYWTVTALQALVVQHGLYIADIERLNTHGGSLRVTLTKHKGQTERIAGFVLNEMAALKQSTYMQFSARVTRRVADINDELLSAGEYIGFGAAAKTTVLLNVLDPRAYPLCVVDETPTKCDKYIPGTKVQIVPKLAPHVDLPIAIFAWNYAAFLIPRLRSQGVTAPIFVPFPEPRWHE